jgi:PIN domain nuclease of toxin-antitoxin system
VPYLIDTHVVIWWALGDRRLSRRATALLRDPDSDLVLSAVLGMEVGVKVAIGKIELPGYAGPEAFFEDVMTRRRFTALPVLLRHGCATAALPLHHRDPFDRLLVSQARCEDLTLVTNDPAFRRYEVRTLW